jgi:hypothetical protein
MKELEYLIAINPKKTPNVVMHIEQEKYIKDPTR